MTLFTRDRAGAHAASVERRDRARARMRRMAHARTRDARRSLLLTLRIAFVALLLAGALGAVVWRAWQLQVGRADELRRLAEEQYLREIELPARRGAIYDRNGAALAVSIDVDSIFAKPREIEDPDGVAAALAPLLGLDPDRLVEKLEAGKRPILVGRRMKLPPGRHFTWLKRRVPPSVADAVARLKLPGIGLTRESKRFYPARELAAHVIGFAGVDGAGLDGLERTFEARLAGRPGEVPGLRDALGRFVTVGSLTPPEALEGESVTLTLDRSLQFIVERELALAVDRHHAAAGNAVILDPNTGEILAMASVPTFNPNAPESAEAATRRNRVIVDAYEPGSTFKPFMVAAALETGVVTPYDKFDTEHGAWRVGKHVIHDFHPYGTLTVSECLSKSSNICMSKIGRKVGARRYSDMLRAFGFGARPGTGMAGENPGILRPPEKWRDIDLATIAFGQGVSASPLQIAAAYAAIANGGIWRHPRIVRGWTAPGTSAFVPIAADPGKRILSEATARAITEMLVAATGPRGTGKRAVVPGYPTAGKTGTAQKVDLVSGGYLPDHFISSFVGFVPADAPRLVIAISLDEPEGEHLGGAVAAPVFHEMARLALRYLGVPPSVPVTEADLVAAGETAPTSPAALAAAANGKAAPAPGALAASGRTEPATGIDAALAAETDALMAAAEAAEPMLSSDDTTAALVARPAASEVVTPGDGGTVLPVPDFHGMSVRTAAVLAAALGLEIEVEGSGFAVLQSPHPGTLVGDCHRIRITFRSPSG